MDKTLETVLGIISAVFVLYTAMIDPKASLIVALVAIVCLVVYRKMFGSKRVSAKPKVVAAKKARVAKKTTKSKKK